MAEEDIGPVSEGCSICGAGPFLACRPDGHTRVKAAAGFAAPDPSSDDELIIRLRRSVNAGIFGIPAEAVEGIQADITELARRLEARGG